MHHPVRAPVLVLVAHGTRSAEGAAVVDTITRAVAAARPDLTVRLAHLDVQEPTVAQVLDELGDAPAVIVPMLLSRGYHVDTDLPEILAGRPGKTLADHLGPDPAVVEALAERARAASPTAGGTTLLVAVPSSRPSARAEIELAARRLGDRLEQPVRAVTLDPAVRELGTGLPGPVCVVPYLIAPGTFLTRLHADATVDAVAEPIADHPNLVALVLARYDAIVRPVHGVG